MSQEENKEEKEKTGQEVLDEWRQWAKDSGVAAFWDNVECIECELGRSCSVHPHVTCPTCKGEGRIPEAKEKK
jgi:hypothetical protein